MPQKHWNNIIETYFYINQVEGIVWMVWSRCFLVYVDLVSRKKRNPVVFSLMLCHCLPKLVAQILCPHALPVCPKMIRPRFISEPAVSRDSVINPSGSSKPDNRWPRDNSKSCVVAQLFESEQPSAVSFKPQNDLKQSPDMSRSGAGCNLVINAANDEEPSPYFSPIPRKSTRKSVPYCCSKPKVSRQNGTTYHVLSLHRMRLVKHLWSAMNKLSENLYSVWLYQIDCGLVPIQYQTFLIYPPPPPKL